MPELDKVNFKIRSIYLLFFTLEIKKTTLPQIKANKKPTQDDPKSNFREKILPCYHKSSITKLFSRILLEELFKKIEPTL